MTQCNYNNLIILVNKKSYAFRASIIDMQNSPDILNQLPSIGQRCADLYQYYFEIEYSNLDMTEKERK